MGLQAVKIEDLLKETQVKVSGLYTKPETIEFMLRKNLAPPVYYIAAGNEKSKGYAVVCETAIDWKFIAGEKHLFSLKMNGAALRNPFMDLSPEVYRRLAGDMILKRQHADALLMLSIPTEFLGHNRKMILSHTPGAVRYLPRGSYPHYYLELEGSFEQYFKKFSANSRKILRKKVRRFSKQCDGSDRIAAYEREEDIGEFYQKALAISKKTYQHKLLGVGLPDTLEFRAYLAFLARNGYFRGYILHHGDREVAYLYSTLIDGLFETHKTGYDPEYANLSPGNVLYYHVIEKLFADKAARLVDFSTGGGPLKQLFATNCTECVDVYYIRKTFRLISIVLLHAAFSAGINFARLIVEKAGIKEKLKHFFRAR